MTHPANQPKDVSSTHSFEAFLKGLLSRFPERSQAIFGLRFGLADGVEQTLEEIGQAYGITRERVRQVVDALLKKMRTEVNVLTQHPTVQRIQQVLEESHGIMTIDALKAKLAKNNVREGQAILALLTILPGAANYKETKDDKAFIALVDFDLKRREKLVDAAKTALKNKNDVVDFKELFSLVTEVLSDEAELLESELKSLVASSKHIEENVFGHYGLTVWESIRPRGTRERAHLILKVFGKPLHFREIARLIDEHQLYKPGKRTHPQTVHNELIKDKRFVLVGRGTYALSDWGYTKGTVRQVLANILKEHQEPMSREELLKAVLKVRQVKKSTVIINLNTFFAKVGKNIYTLRDVK